jgi:hypothetical protein
MISWKWSTGEAYYKSARPEKQENTESALDYDSKQNAINQSLDDEIDNVFSRNNGENRREALDNKISDRQMIPQRGVNPFMQQTSYVNDIVTRDMFLKPVNTTQGKLKTILEE